MRLMKVTTALALVLALTGCFDNQKKAETPAENPRREAVREGLVGLQVLTSRGVNPATLSEALVTIDTKARIALIHKAITSEQMAQIDALLKAGDILRVEWEQNFLCGDRGKDYFQTSCVKWVWEKLAAIGVSEEKLKELKDEEVKYAAEHAKDWGLAKITPNEAIGHALVVMDKKAAAIVQALPVQ
jgi:hypothetical protein